MIRQIDRIDDTIRRLGSITSADSIPFCSISNFSARMSDAMKVYPIKRVEVRRKTPNRYGDRPSYYRYYYKWEDIRFPRGEEIVRWLDEEDPFATEDSA